MFGTVVTDVCQGTSNGLVSVNETPENRIRALRSRYENCLYVDGNLEITGLDHEQLYSTDRKSVVEGKSVNLGGRRIIQQKTRDNASSQHAHGRASRVAHAIAAASSP